MARNSFPVVAEIEKESAESSRELSLISTQIENTEQQLATVQRSRKAASERGDVAGVARYTTEATRLSDTLELLRDKKKPLEDRATRLYQQLNAATRERAQHQLTQARERAESEMRDISQRLTLARVTVNELETRYNQLQTRLGILRSGDLHPGAAALDPQATLERAKAYDRAITESDDRELVKLRDGRRARLVGFVGVNHDAVVQVEGSHERLTVPESEIVPTRSAAVAV